VRVNGKLQTITSHLAGSFSGLPVLLAATSMSLALWQNITPDPDPDPESRAQSRGPDNPHGPVGHPPCLVYFVWL